jgi:hypothetical protein
MLSLIQPNHIDDGTDRRDTPVLTVMALGSATNYSKVWEKNGSTRVSMRSLILLP